MGYPALTAASFLQEKDAAATIQQLQSQAGQGWQPAVAAIHIFISFILRVLGPWFMSFPCSMGSMTAVAIYTRPGAPAVWAAGPVTPWTFLGWALVLMTLGMALFYRCCYVHNKGNDMKDPPCTDESLPPLCASSPDRLTMSRLANQGAVNLATFVTRRPSRWADHQLRGHDCFLILD